MSTVNGFQVGSETLKYNYESLDNYNTPNFSASSSTAYAVGDYVMYNGKLYKCTTATTGGTWVSGSWTEAVLSDDMSDLNRQISDVEESLIYNHYPTLAFSVGGVQSPNGEFNSLDTRLRTSFYLPKTIVQVGVQSGYEYFIAAYASDGSYIGIWDGSVLKKSGVWYSTSTNVRNIGDYYFIVCVRRSDNQIIQMSEATNVTFRSVADDTLTVDGMPANAFSSGVRLDAIEKNIANISSYYNYPIYLSGKTIGNASTKIGSVRLKKGQKYTITATLNSALTYEVYWYLRVNNELVLTTLISVGNTESTNTYTPEADCDADFTVLAQSMVPTNISFAITSFSAPFLGYYTPEMYGAVGDGVTDDTQAFVRMFANGAYAYRLDGKYAITGIDIPVRDICIYGKGTVIVSGLGFVFQAPENRKEIHGLSFELTNAASFAIRTSGKPADTGICTLKISNINVKTTLMSTKAGLYIQGETSALLCNVSLTGCGMRFYNCTNPSVDNCVIMYTSSGVVNSYIDDGFGTTEPYACGLNLHNTTIIGCTIGVKAVCVDSIIISESMLDFNDNPVVILGSEEPKLISSYFSSRQGNPVIWMDKNNSDSGVHGGNGLSTEEMHYVSIQDCVFIQYNESTTNPTIHIGNCECADIRSINVMYAGKAGIEFVHARNVIVDGFICNTIIAGSNCILSYDANGVLADDSSMLYKNFITSLPIYVQYARTDLSCDSYKTKSEGTMVVNANVQTVTKSDIIPQGVDRCIVTTNDGTAVTYQESGKNITFNLAAHANPVRINYIVYGKKTYEQF